MDIVDEKWDFVPKTNNKYEISTFGSVRCCSTGNYVSISYTNMGYEIFRVQLNNQQITMRIHRVMGEVFLGLNPKSKDIIFHKNRCVYDNYLENLEIRPHRTARGKDIIYRGVGTRKVTTDDDKKEILYYLNEDYSIKEVSRITGWSTHTVSILNQWRENACES